MKEEASKMEFVVEKAPHLRRKDNAFWMFLDVLIALAPTLIFAILVYGWYAIRAWLLCVVPMVGAELIFVLIEAKKRKIPFKEAFDPINVLAPLISGEIMALMFTSQDTSPSGFIYFAIPLSALFGIIIGKLVFGGTGKNIFNPAAVGFVFFKICFGSSLSGGYHYNVFNLPFLSAYSDTAITGSTFLSSSGLLTDSSLYTAENILKFLIGDMAGGMGEACKITLIVGLAYLLIRRVADWRVVLSSFLTFVATGLIVGLIVSLNSSINAFYYMLLQLLSGSFLYGMVFMITDPVTMPVTMPGRVMYGVSLSLLVFIIRLFASLPEGVAYSVLICNALVALFEYFKWAKTEFTWKTWAVTGGIFLAGILAISLGLLWQYSDSANAEIALMGGGF